MTGIRADAGSAVPDVVFLWNGTEIHCRMGETIATALLCAGQLELRRSPRAGNPRGAWCMMGVCQECLIRVDGVVRQACLTPAESGLRVSAATLSSPLADEAR